MPVIGDLPIDKWKVAELKEELRKRKLSAAGLKVELVNRLKKAVLDELENEGSADMEEDTVGDVEDAGKAMETEVSGMDSVENTKEKASETSLLSDNKIGESGGAETETCFVGVHVGEGDSTIGGGEDAGVKIVSSAPDSSVISRIEADAEPEGLSVQEAEANRDDGGIAFIDENSKVYENVGAHDGNTMEEEHGDHLVLESESKHDGDARLIQCLQNDDVAPVMAKIGTHQNDDVALVLKTRGDDPVPVAIEKTEGHHSDDISPVLKTEDDDPVPTAIEKAEINQNDNIASVLNTEDDDPVPVAVEKTEIHPSDNDALVLDTEGNPVPVTVEKTEAHQNDNNTPVLNTEGDDPMPVTIEKAEAYQNDSNAPVLNVGDDDPVSVTVEKTEGRQNDGDALVLPVRNMGSKGDMEKSEKTRNDDCAPVPCERAENKGGDYSGRVTIGKSENDDDASVTGEKRLASHDQVLPGGVRVKSDSLSINENNETKDNITVHHVTLEVEETTERRQALPLPVDRSTETKQAMDTTSYSEKLNLDRSSGEDSMEEDAPETKQVDSNFSSVETPTVKNEYLPCQPEHNQQQQPSKRKSQDGDPEILKRQRRWNPERSEPPVKHDLRTSESDSVKERFVPPSQKPATNSLRIDRFLRPFTIKAVHELLRSTGNFTSFWMDHIKTHCYVTYGSVEEAVRTRNGVYNVQWPPNGGKLLTAEFVDSEEVRMKLEPPPPLPPPPPVLLPSQQLLPPPPPYHLPPPPPLLLADRQQQRLPPPPPLPMESQELPLVTLDDLFRKTKTAPRIYYLPVSEEEAAARRGNQAESAVVGNNGTAAAAPVPSS